MEVDEVQEEVEEVEEEEDEEEEEEEEEIQVEKKINKVDQTSGRRASKRVYEVSEESDEDEGEVSRKLDIGGRRSSRRVSNRPSRRNSLENDDNSRPQRRSSRKVVEESPAERRASKRSFDAFNTISLSSLIDEVIKHKYGWPFLKPVSVSEVPDYFDVIKQPMDFSKIKSKLNLGDYSTNEQAMKDVELVFYNCDLYNTSESEIYK